MLKQKIIFLTLFTIASLSLYAESFRVSKVNTVSFSDDNYQEQTAKLGISEALAIYLPDDKTFIEGIELKMDIPDTIACWQDSVACSVYDHVSPNPSASKIDYTATRQFVSTIPGRLSWVLQIPIKKGSKLKTNQYTTKMDTIPDISKNVIFMRLQPVMKGIPEETMNSIISVTIKPILTDKGQLELKLSSEDSDLQPCSIYIDDTPVEFTVSKSNTAKLLLDKGIHDVAVISDYYRNEVRTVRIDQAKTTKLTVDMRSTEPTLIISAPEGTKVFIDDKPFNNFGTEFTASEGDHRISFSIGDYEITRNLSVTKGKTYTINFSLDLQITEE